MPYVPSFDSTIGLLGDPAPSWRWVVALPNLLPRVQTVARKTLTGLTPTTIAPFGLVSRITFGKRVIDSESRFAGGRKFNYPRWISTPNSAITFYENSAYLMTQYLESWSNLVVDQDGNFTPSANYKYPITLYAYDIVNNRAPSMVGTLVGCWPPSVSGYEYAYDASGPVTLTCDFCVDESLVSVGGSYNLGGVSGTMPYNNFAALMANGPLPPR